MKLNELLGDPAWLFDLGFPILQLEESIARPQKLEWQLDASFSIPSLSSLSGGKQFAKLSIAWNSDGIFLHARLRGAASTASSNLAAKTQLMALYLDTRWSPGVHRATSYCHRFDFLLNRPNQSLPCRRGHGELSPIQRARSAPAEIHPDDISVATFFDPEGYDIKAYLKGAALTGYSPTEFQEIGLFYTINDTEFGNQIMARTLQSPYFEDPSVWCRGKLLQTSA